MANKTLGYYQRTLQSKVIALLHFYLDKAGLLYFYKRSIQRKMENLFESSFISNLIEPNIEWTPLFITYLRFTKPFDLAKDLVFDKKGIPFGSAWHPPPDYNPLFAAYYGLICYNHYIQTGNQGSFEIFKKQTLFLSNFGEIKNDSYLLIYKKDFKLISHLKAPFYTGITQALALSVFVRAYKATGERKFAILADMTWQSFFIPVEDGGVFRLFEDKYHWVEEYPGIEPDMTLNGFIFNIIAGYEYLHLLGGFDKKVEDKLKEMLYSFFSLFSRYIFGRYTRYNLKYFTFHNISYQGLFVFMFLHLYQLSGKKEFKDLAILFQKNTNWNNYFEYYNLQGSIAAIIKPLWNLKN